MSRTIKTIIYEKSKSVVHLTENSTSLLQAYLHQSQVSVQRNVKQTRTEASRDVLEALDAWLSKL